MKQYNMNKDIIIEMPDKSQWRLKAFFVARDRAEILGNGNPERIHTTLTHTLASNDLLLEWASNHMTWRQIRHYAQRVEPAEENYEDWWAMAHKLVGDKKS